MIKRNTYTIYDINKRNDMDITNEIVLMKEQRDTRKKTNLNVTLDETRLNDLKKKFGEKSPFFKMINKSEQIDFLLYFLEKYMNSSPMFANNEN